MKSVFLFCLPLMSACTLGLNTMDKTIDTGSVSGLDTGDIVDTGISVDTAEDTDADTNTDTDTQTDSDTDTEDTSTPTTDVDQDGFSVEDGDCDDYDPFINPVQLDDCDGVDNNCDGILDNDAIGGIYEPNDTPWNGFYIGDYTAGDYTSVQGLISTPTDIDIYEFYIEDGWFDDFKIDFELHALGIQADFVAELWLIENASGDREDLLLSVNNLTTGGIERADWEGDWLTDDSGYYEFRISAVSGQDCNAHYELEIWMSP